MAEIVSLAEAIAEAVHDGDAVAMEGFTHLIPHYCVVWDAISGDRHAFGRWLAGHVYAAGAA